eukprot:GHVR01111624.1.p1 GENE.GHVR01111624.1~~GHVR01111624.1.p1  ORF type:complete len:497 (+),score=102.58 GHVR01111624.1:291-1781(+)
MFSSFTLSMIAMECITIICLCFFRSVYSCTTIYIQQEFKWSCTLRSIVISSYLFGYAFSQLFSFIFTDKYGGKKVLQLCLPTSLFLLVIQPIICKYSILAVLIRLLHGIADGCVFPSLQILCTRYLHPSVWRTAGFAGIVASLLGSFSGFGIGPILLVEVGWRSVLSIIGMSYAICGILWQLYTPVDGSICGNLLLQEDDEFIAYPNSSEIRTSWGRIPSILGHLGPSDPLNQSNYGGGAVESYQDTTLNYGFFKYIKYKQIWAILITQFSVGFANFFLFYIFPFFISPVEMNKHIHTHTHAYKDTSSSNYYFLTVAFPYLFEAVIVIVMSQPITSTRLKGKYAHRVFQSIALGGPLLSLLITTCRGFKFLSVSWLIVFGCSLSAFSLSSLTINHMEIAPEAAAMLYVIGNTFNVIGGVVCVCVCGIVCDVFTNNGVTICLVLVCVNYIAGLIVWNTMVGDTPIIDENTLLDENTIIAEEKDILPTNTTPEVSHDD